VLERRVAAARRLGDFFRLYALLALDIVAPILLGGRARPSLLVGSAAVEAFVGPGVALETATLPRPPRVVALVVSPSDGIILHGDILRGEVIFARAKRSGSDLGAD